MEEKHMNYTVLVVDDEENQRRALIEKVDWARAGFEVIGEAENGVEALPLVEMLEPDLVMTDIRMPLMTGLELAAKVREVRPATQMVILSGYDSFEYAQTAIKYNIISYLLKPISSSEMSDELLKIRRRMDENLDKMLSFSSSDTGETMRKLAVTEFLLPLMLGSSDNAPERDELNMNAAELGIIDRNASPKYGVFVSKFQNADGENCTGKTHISFINAVLSKYLRSESFFAYGRIVTLVVVEKGDIASALELPLREIVQSAGRLLNLHCTIGVSREIDSLALCSGAYFQAVTARRYTSDGAGEVRFIDDQEHDSEFEFEYVEKSVFTLEQLLKVGSKSELEEFLNGLYEQNSHENADLFVIQILATVYRTVSAVSDRPALAELIASNPIFTRLSSYSSEKVMRSELIGLCLNAREIISRYQKRDSEILCDRVIQIIDEEYGDENLSLTSVSSRLSVSPNYLSALIKKTKKKNFVTLVTERRMKAAYDMLVCSPMKILEVAEKCGYSDQHYFSYCFKKHYGESPNHVRSSSRGSAE